MEHSWRTSTAGILNIIAGVGMLFVCFWLVVAGGITSMVGNVPQWLPGFLFALAVPFVILSILAVIGGIFSSFVMELLVYPAIYFIWKWKYEMKQGTVDVSRGQVK